jgi:hypothetical protein
MVIAEHLRASPQGSIVMEATDSSSGAPIAARLQFTKSPRKVPRSRTMLVADDQWLLERSLPLALANGDYEFIVKRGPEFSEIRGGFTIETKAKDVVSIEVPRSVDMRAESWFSGDHLSSFPPDILSRWQLADAIDMVVSTSSPGTTQATQTTSRPSSSKPKAARLDEANEADASAVGSRLLTRSRRLSWNHGCLLIHDDKGPVDAESSSNDGSNSISESLAGALLAVAAAKRNEHATVELMHPWTRDVPILLATQNVHAVQLLSEFNRRSSDDRIQLSSNTSTKILRGKVSPTLGKSKTNSEIFAPLDSDDELKYKNARGVGRLTETLYWQMLDAGLRLTPTAGSGAGTDIGTLGYNRVYVHSDTPPDVSRWWASIRKGNTMVTNGPLLRVLVNGQPPGSVLASYRGQSIPLDIQASLTVRDPVDYLDVVFNGETIYSAKLEDHYRRGEFPPLDIDRSGWLVIRVIVASDQGYRLATTAPYYFEFDGKPRVSKRAIQFFQSWLQASRASLSEEPDWKALSPAFAQAEQFWAARESSATAE